MIDRHEIEKTVIELAKRHVDAHVTVSTDSRLTENLNLINDYIYLLIDLEQFYKLKIPSEKFSDVCTLGDIVDIYFGYLGNSPIA